MTKKQLNPEDLKMVLTFSDIHYPENIDLEPIFEFIKDNRELIDEVIYIGDIINGDGIGPFWKGDPEEGVFSTVAEIKGFVEDVHDRVRELLPDVPITLTGGNHLAERIRKKLAKKPYLEEVLDLHQYMPDVNMLDYGEYYQVGDLYYTHGNYFNMHHAKKHADIVGKSVVYGHTHSVQEHTKETPVDDDPIKAKSIGCLTNTNPHYRHNVPNRWVNAFHVAYVRPDGKFYDYTIPIVDGGFMFNGVLYQGKKG